MNTSCMMVGNEFYKTMKLLELGKRVKSLMMKIDQLSKETGSNSAISILIFLNPLDAFSKGDVEKREYVE